VYPNDRRVLDRLTNSLIGSDKPWCVGELLKGSSSAARYVGSTKRISSAALGQGPHAGVWRTLLKVSKETVARLCFGATFVIAAFSVGLQFVQDWLGVWVARSASRDGPRWRMVRLNALTGITITGLVHWFLLHPLDDFHGLPWASDTLVHIIVPVIAVLGWLVFGGGGSPPGLSS
jgi:hypothetical protein